MNKLMPGRPVPLVEGFDAIARKHKLSDYKGSTILLMFWSRGMASYSEFERSVNAMVKANKGRKFHAIGVTADPLEPIRAGIADGSQQWRNFIDVEGKITKEFRVPQLPYCYIIDQAGSIVYRGGLGGPLYAEKLSSSLAGKISE